MQIHKPTTHTEDESQLMTEEEIYFQSLQSDEKFQRYVIGGLFNMEEFMSILNFKSSGDMEKVGLELIIRQEVAKQIQARIYPIAAKE